MTVTAVCQTIGAIYTLANSVTQIITPTRGWQTVNNPNPAVIGSPVETDGQLRKRQTISTAIPSRSIVSGILGAIHNLPSVLRAKLYENYTNEIDVNNLPPHSIAAVVEGGDVGQIAKTIALKKGPGCYTHGDINIDVADAYGVPMSIKFFRPVDTQVYYKLTIKPLNGFSEPIKSKIQNALVDYTNSLDIGESVIYTKLFVPANLGNSDEGNTYEIMEFLISSDGSNFNRADINTPFNGSAICSFDQVEIKVP